jgi:hypothetical protein
MRDLWMRLFQPSKWHEKQRQLAYKRRQTALYEMLAQIYGSREIKLVADGKEITFKF